MDESMNIPSRAPSLPVRAVASLLRGYKRVISPLLPPACRYTPTCSEYALEAVLTYGVLKGMWLGLKRILRCHPWGGFGYDPVPMDKGKRLPP